MPQGMGPLTESAGSRRGSFMPHQGGGEPSNLADMVAAASGSQRPEKRRKGSMMPLLRDAAQKAKEIAREGAMDDPGNEVFLRNRLNKKDLKAMETADKATKDLQSVIDEKQALLAKTEALQQKLLNVRHLLDAEQKKAQRLEDKSAALT